MHAILLAAVALPFTAATLYPKASPDPAPKGYSQYTSPIVLPAPNVDGSDGWSAAVSKARQFVNSLTLEEKINMTSGVGTTGRCIGNTGMVPRLGFEGICLDDSPVGPRWTDGNSVFPAGINMAATFDKNLIFSRAAAMGAEFRGKGNFALGPSMNLMGVAQALTLLSVLA
jgi:beta-glucosidase